MAVCDLLDVDLAWVSDIDKGANKILAHRYPDTPNLGDFTTVDWRQVEPVEIFCAGFPCQDVSHAGKRAGLKPGTRTGVWTKIADAIDVLRPSLCVFENVRGLLSAEAHSDVEPCPWCVGDASDGSLRALGAVLGDLAERGYDCRVTGLRAADVGAPHGRFRVFVVAWDSAGRHGLYDFAAERAPGNGHRPTDLALLPTPRATDPAGEMSRSSDGFRPQLGEVARLLPTPTKADGAGGNASPFGKPTQSLPAAVKEGLLDRWGDYAPAIARWETTIGRPAPAPTETGPKGSPRLSPVFVEWMMGLPEGWVTDVPGLTRNEQLKALGNGVVPQQAATAVGWLLDQITRKAVA